MPLLLLKKLVQILLMLTMLNAAIYANVFNAELCCDVCCVAINMDQLYSNVYWLEAIYKLVVIHVFEFSWFCVTSTALFLKSTPVLQGTHYTLGL